MRSTHCLCQQTTFFRSPRHESRRTPKLGAESLSSVLCAVSLFESVRSEAPNARSPEAKPLAGCYACRQTGVILPRRTRHGEWRKFQFLELSIFFQKTRKEVSQWAKPRASIRGVWNESKKSSKIGLKKIVKITPKEAAEQLEGQIRQAIKNGYEVGEISRMLKDAGFPIPAKVIEELNRTPEMLDMNNMEASDDSSSMQK